jgi:hypothetical protein
MFIVTLGGARDEHSNIRRGRDEHSNIRWWVEMDTVTLGGG